MTGYGRADGMVSGRQVSVEIRCYNHRYKDVRMHLPRGWVGLEVTIDKLIRNWVGRGRVECSVHGGSGSANVGKPVLDLESAREYIKIYKQLAQEIDGQPDIKEVSQLSLLANSEGVVVFSEGLDEFDTAQKELTEIVRNALSAAAKMRTEEGKELEKEIQSRLGNIAGIVSELKNIVGSETDVLKERMIERINTLADNVEVDEERIAQEVAICAEKMDVTEELTRFDSHIVQYEKLIKKQEPIGREMDFLLQEMNRETNTIGSKLHSALVTEQVVSLKAEIEKIREQIQNVE
jgi:uncharacterized protein (TIGR00255 family)